MPIFMDRHDVPGLTAMDVAEGHKQDLKIQHKYNCRALTYWYDEKRGTAFCLIEAPHRKAVEQMHDDSHGLVPNQIIEVEGDVVEAFLGRIEDPQTHDESDFLNSIDPAFRTIMVTELKDASLIPLKLGIDKGRELLLIHNQLIQQAIKRFDGRKVQHTGSGFMASFASVSKAVTCAIEIQKQLREQNSQSFGYQMHVAIGLSAGDPVTDKTEIFEEAIQFAKRLCCIARKDQVVISSLVRDNYKREGVENLSEDTPLKSLNPMEEKFLNQLMDITERTWNQEGLKVSDFGKQMGLSKSQLYRKITSLTGYSPNEFIKEFRLKKAIELIERQQDNISQIAYEAGFNSLSYFSKCFHKRFGILPSVIANALE